MFYWSAVWLAFPSLLWAALLPGVVAGYVPLGIWFAAVNLVVMG